MKGKKHKMSVSTTGRADISELSALGRLTRKLLRRPVRPEPLGKKLSIILLDDLDPDGRIYPDFKKRRRARKAAEEKDQSFRRLVQHDWKPDND